MESFMETTRPLRTQHCSWNVDTSAQRIAYIEYGFGLHTLERVFSRLLLLIYNFYLLNYVALRH